MNRAALFVCLLASCVAPPSGPYATGPAYSGGYVAAPAPAARPYDYQATHTGYDFDQAGYPAGYPAGYQAGYPNGYPVGVEAYPQQECKSAYGATACGFGCVAAYGQVRCAAMPGGACTAAYGQVTCFEAPQTVSGGYGAMPSSECKSAYGSTACGFGCVAAYGTVRCAQEPGGACSAAYGQVTCTN